MGSGIELEALRVHGQEDARASGIFLGLLGRALGVALADQKPRRRLLALAGAGVLDRFLQQRQAAWPIADHDLVRCEIDADAVGIVTEVRPGAFREIGGFEAADRAVARAGHINGVVRREIGDALRCVKARDPMHDAPLIQVDDRDAVVAKLGHDEPSALGVVSEAIDPARYLPQGNARLESEGLRGAGGGAKDG